MTLSTPTLPSSIFPALDRIWYEEITSSTWYFTTNRKTVGLLLLLLVSCRLSRDHEWTHLIIMQIYKTCGQVIFRNVRALRISSRLSVWLEWNSNTTIHSMSADLSSLNYHPHDQEVTLMVY